ncbi:MAG: hypothetical protein ACRENP_22770, partial [Longimicrobiales bacterium]
AYGRRGHGRERAGQRYDYQGQAARSVNPSAAPPQRSSLLPAIIGFLLAGVLIITLGFWTAARRGAAPESPVVTLLNPPLDFDLGGALHGTIGRFGYQVGLFNGTGALLQPHEPFASRCARGRRGSVSGRQPVRRGR